MGKLVSQMTPEEAARHRAWRREYMITWRQQNPKRMQGYRIKHRYGIDEADYQAMYEAQNGLCAICAEPETARHSAGGPRRLSVDHCHETGRVRGLLCHQCNRLLGLFGDDPVKLMRALVYLGNPN